MTPPWVRGLLGNLFYFGDDNIALGDGAGA